uniref:Putative secreted protein n=1 Tax=Ixodes ricinus TaxID=34613 RepID=A0A6B0U5C7_IXORI
MGRPMPFILLTVIAVLGIFLLQGAEANMCGTITTPARRPNVGQVITIRSRGRQGGRGKRHYCLTSPLRPFTVRQH